MSVICTIETRLGLGKTQSTLGIWQIRKYFLNMSEKTDESYYMVVWNLWNRNKAPLSCIDFKNMLNPRKWSIRILLKVFGIPGIYSL